MKIEILNDGDLTCFKGTANLIEEKEFETFDNYIHEIAKEYCELNLKEKDQILTQRLIKKQEEEIERLNNIIEELEKWLNQQIIMAFKSEVGYYIEVANKLKELKEDKK